MIDASQESPRAASSEAIDRNEQRAPVWLIEDDPLFRDTMSDLIQSSARFRCAHAFANGEDALALLAQGKDLPRLILMDLTMPIMSGIECTRAIRKRNSAIPVIMLTVHQSNDRIFEAICAGASGYLLKSQPGGEILRSLETALDGGAAMDGQIARRVLEMFAKFVTPAADYRLSDREREILELMVAGRTKGQIAERLVLSPHTIDKHVRNIYTKLHVNNRSGAVAKALKENLI